MLALRAGRLRPTHTLFRRSITPNIQLNRWKQTASETSETLTSDQAANADDSKGPKLSYLSRPLGVHEKPSAAARSWEEKKAELLDYDKHIEKRRHLVKEATRGYFQDFHALRHHGGKTWLSPSVLIRENKALYYPDVAGVALTPQSTVHTTSLLEGRISIVSMLTTTMSEEHVKSFTNSTLEAHQSHPLFRFVQINLQENPLKGFLVGMFLSSIRSRTPADLQPTYLVSRQNMEYMREPLGMINKHIGYVYLVDENCKIRWAGCGFAKDEESIALQNCTRVLLQRLSRAVPNSLPPTTDASPSPSVE